VTLQTSNELSMLAAKSFEIRIRIQLFARHNICYFFKPIFAKVIDSDDDTILRSVRIVEEIKASTQAISSIPCP
jgi:hypothetical protein